MPREQLLLDSASRMIDSIGLDRRIDRHIRRKNLFALVNAKFDFAADCLALVLARAAAQRKTFNYHEKLELASALNRGDMGLLTELVSLKGVSLDALDGISPPSHAVTKRLLHSEMKTPTLVRKDSKPRDWSREILCSLFGGFVFSSFPNEVAHGFFDPSSGNYEPDFWLHLHARNPQLFSRSHTLTHLSPPPGTPIELLFQAVKQEYGRLANHGHLSIHLEGWGDEAWRAAARLTIFAEKFIRTRLPHAFFQHKKIAAETLLFNPQLDETRCQFAVADLGFSYRDTFVFADQSVSSVLLLFQKNSIDETIIPCPACRSHDVQGNSYSSLGVKSWECRNPLCPDRTKFNRGKRYSFLQLLKQQAINDPNNEIPLSSIRNWARDVQPSSSSDAIVDMLVRHYSLAGDGICTVDATPSAPLGRNLRSLSWPEYKEGLSSDPDAAGPFSGPYFIRATARPVRSVDANIFPTEKRGALTAINGDSTDVLFGMATDSFDGAVTSPPYYNAREYSQWPNIYCYLSDMRRNAEAICRVLKPGGYYLFNIFDYFDNENNVALSAMGEKRMILSAYCVELFERVGLKCEGNIVWDKGAIEGKRAFNGGNNSPYYQAPFNCWEHILVFRKPGDKVHLISEFPSIIRARPVLKMVRGENRHGHTAPFPEELPLLLLERLKPGTAIVDPYAGSMTTGVAAARCGIAATCIEINKAYFELGLAKFEQLDLQGDLFQFSA